MCLDPDLLRAAIRRALLVASEFPFKQVIGVEFAAELDRIAKENIRKFRNSRCSVTSIHGDASLYDFPRGNLVIYLYHPFGEPVLRAALENLKNAILREDRRVYVVYFNPLLAHVFDEMRFLERLPLDTEAAVYHH